MNRLLAACVVLSTAAAAPAQLFLVDDAATPHVKVTWPKADGSTGTLEGDRQYLGLNERTVIGGNLECFVTVGGIRLARGLGDPHGVIVRLGFVKVDNAKLLFENIAADASVTFELTNMRFTDKPAPVARTTIQELGYGLDPALCGMPGQVEAQYNTYGPTDDLRGKITPDNGRLGVLDGKDPGDGAATFTATPDGVLSMKAVVPYRLFRHVKDPWLRESPGAFREPNHFHIEFEVLPVGVTPHDEAPAKPPPPPTPEPAPPPASDPRSPR